VVTCFYRHVREGRKELAEGLKGGWTTADVGLLFLLAIGRDKVEIS